MKTFYVFAILFLLITSSQNSFSQYWYEDTSGVTVQLNSVICLSYNRAWCCGNNGTVLKISPSYFARRWVNVSGNGIPSNINLLNISAPDNDTSIALTTGTLGGTAFVYRTSNAGASWQQVFQQANGNINAMWYSQFSIVNAYLIGNPLGGRWSLFRSTNGGVTWDSSGMYLPQNGSETGWGNSYSFYNGYTWIGTNNSRIYYSTNSGMNWSVKSIAPEQNSFAIRSAGSYVLSGGSGLMRTTNNGTNWTQVSSLGSGNFGGIGNFSNYWWYVRSDNKIYYSIDNGSTFSIQYSAPSGVYTNLFLNGYTVFMYAIRSNGGISKYPIIVGIQPVSGEIPEEFSLSQNYPNPFNPQTKIKFSIPLSRGVTAEGGRGVFVSLIIYNLLGREVTTLLNQELKPGTYEADWDGSNYSSGVYFYKLEAGDFTETKKMVLLK